MADFNKLKDTIRGAIYPNGRGAISADKHQAALLDMADTMQETAAQLTELSAEIAHHFAKETSETYDYLHDEIDFALKKGAKIVNRGIDLIIASDSSLADSVTILKGTEYVLNSDKEFLCSVPTGKIDFDYVPPTLNDIINAIKSETDAIKSDVRSISEEIYNYESEVKDITQLYEDEKQFFYGWSNDYGSYAWEAYEGYYWRLYKVAVGETVILRKKGERSTIMATECKKEDFVAGGRMGNTIIEVGAPLGDYEFINNSSETKYIALLYKYFDNVYFDVFLEESVSLTDVVRNLEKANGLITTDRLADESVTIAKTDFVKVAAGEQLFNNATMAENGAWYWFDPNAIGGVGGYAKLESNEYTGHYTAIKIPIKGIETVTVSQLKGTTYAYFVTDAEMKVLAYGTPNTPIDSGYVIKTIGGEYLLLDIVGYDENKLMVNKGSNPLPYAPFAMYTYINGIMIKDIEEKSEEIKVSLPNTIYAVVGDTLQVFYRGLIQAVNPYNYYILISCEKGRQFPRYWEYQPTSADIGETTFTIYVRDNSTRLLKSASCKIVTIAKGVSPSSSINVACFGDSLTDGGDWCAEAARRLTGEGGQPSGDDLNNIAFVGKKKKNGYGYYGEGGWTWKSYTTKDSEPAYRFYVNNVSSLSLNATYSLAGITYTIKEINVTAGSGNILCIPYGNTTPPSSGTMTKITGNGDATIAYASVQRVGINPLWDDSNNRMSFIPYANAYCNGKIDIVYTLLTWNGLTDNQKDFSAIISDVKIFADTLHREFPSAKMKIMGLQIPSVTGGMGANYGANGGYADHYGMSITAFNLNKAYQDFAMQDSYKGFVEYVDIASQFDTEYNMPYAMEKVNVRSSQTEMRGTNGVHPSIDGYMQIADVVYRSICAEL